MTTINNLIKVILFPQRLKTNINHSTKIQSIHLGIEFTMSKTEQNLISILSQAKIEFKKILRAPCLIKEPL